MPKVVVKKQAQAAATEVFAKVKSFLANDSDLKKLDPSYQTTFNDGAMTGQASGKLFKADMTVKSTGSGSEVEIVVDLPLTLALAKGMVQRTLEKKLNDSLT